MSSKDLNEDRVVFDFPLDSPLDTFTQIPFGPVFTMYLCCLASITTLESVAINTIFC